MNAELKYLHFPGPGTGSTADEILQELVNEGYNKIPDLPPEARITKADLDARPKISFEPDLDLRLDKVGG
jgi:hypothetical protein